MSTIHFIGGEKGGVGKSVTSRLLAQYYVDSQQPLIVFDSDRSHGALLRFYREFCLPVNLDDFESSDQIMDAATEDDRAIIVDLAAQTAASLQKWTAQSDLPGLAQELGVPLWYWHVMDDGRDTLTVLDDLLDTFGDTLGYVIVRNHGRGKDFTPFNTSEVCQRAVAANARFFDLGELHTNTMKKIDHLGISFWAAANNKDAGLGLLERQRVRVWLKNCYKQLEGLDCLRL